MLLLFLLFSIPVINHITGDVFLGNSYIYPTIEQVGQQNVNFLRLNEDERNHAVRDFIMLHDHYEEQGDDQGMRTLEAMQPLYSYAQISKVEVVDKVDGTTTHRVLTVPKKQ